MKILFKVDYQLSRESYELGYTDETTFDFKANTPYTVFGICIWHGALHYLTIEHEGGLPSWYPAEIFRIYDPSLPFDWYFKYYGYNSNTGLVGVWGYKELVESYEHYIGLLERESEHIKIFLERKKEIWGES